MITRALVATAFVGLAGVGGAAPALAAPGDFGDISCSCTAPDPRPPLLPHSLNAPQDPIDRGIEQGLIDTDPQAARR